MDTRSRAGLSLALLALPLLVSAQTAPGKPGWSGDQPPLQRDLMVLESLLPGTWDNYEQTYFDNRLGLPAAERHRRTHTEVRRIEDARFGGRAFYLQTHLDDDPANAVPRIATLRLDPVANALRLEFRDVASTDHAAVRGAQDDATRLAGVSLDSLATDTGCDLFLTRTVDAFSGGTRGKACRAGRGRDATYTRIEFTIGQRSFWTRQEVRRLRDDAIVGVDAPAPYRHNRARWFSCSLTLGEGPDAKRFTRLAIMDQGGTAWLPVPTPEQPAREVGLQLRNVDWAMNNSPTAFTNDVFSFYLDERWPGRSQRHIVYSFQAADSERAGINLIYMQAYCVLREQTRAQPRL